METYQCASCGGTFEKGWSDEEAEAEAKELFDVDDASTDPSVAVICDNCFRAARKREEEFLNSPEWQAQARWVLDFMTGKIKI